jgi:ElaB/YqjD/DUF883 family membrane-anchored ribosome-binding protein
MNENSGTTRVIESAGHVRDDLRELGVEAGRLAREKATGARERFEDKVRDNPLKSLAIAAGVGVLVGYLLRRR